MHLPMCIKAHSVRSPLPVHLKNAPGSKWHNKAEHIVNQFWAKLQDTDKCTFAKWHQAAF